MLEKHFHPVTDRDGMRISSPRRQAIDPRLPF